MQHEFGRWILGSVLEVNDLGWVGGGRSNRKHNSDNNGIYILLVKARMAEVLNKTLSNNYHLKMSGQYQNALPKSQLVRILPFLFLDGDTL
jgi:hypothetical protein